MQKIKGPKCRFKKMLSSVYIKICRAHKCTILTGEKHTENQYENVLRHYRILITPTQREPSFYLLLQKVFIKSDFRITKTQNN